MVKIREESGEREKCSNRSIEKRDKQREKVSQRGSVPLYILPVLCERDTKKERERNSEKFPEKRERLLEGEGF